MTLSPDAIRATLHKLAIEHLRRDAPLPEGDLSAHLDSMQRLSLVVAIEDHYRICFDPEDDEAVHTLDDVIAIVHRKLGESADA